MKTDFRYSEQDYLDALQGAGPLGWQKDLKAIVRELVSFYPQAVYAPILRDERDELERDKDLLELDVERLEDEILDLKDRISDLEEMLDEAQGRS